MNIELFFVAEEVRDHIILDEYNLEIADQMFTCLQKFTDNTQIKQSAYSIIKHLCQDDGMCRTYFKNFLFPHKQGLTWS